MKTDMQTILNRLARVERQNRALKWAGVALLVLILFGSFWGQTASNKNVVKAEEFVLLDDQGRYRAVLEMTDSGPSFSLVDRVGTDRVKLALWPEGSPGLYLNDAKGELRATLAVGPDGLARIRLLNEIGEKHFEMPPGRDLEFADPPQPRRNR